MELTHEQLAESCTRNGVTAYICGQDYWATLNDAEDNGVAPEDRKAWTMEQMLSEELDFGPYSDEDDDEGANLEARDDILCEVVAAWVNGEFTAGKGTRTANGK